MNIGNHNNLSSSQLFLLSLSSICLDTNLSYHSTLYGCKSSIRNRGRAFRKLETTWQIKNAQDLRNKLHWLLEEGTRQEFNEIRSFLSSLSESNRQEYINSLSQEYANYSKPFIVNYYLRRLPVDGILSYDYARYCYLCRIGSMAGYLSKNEAWDLMKNIGELAQKSYFSWNEYITGYIAGSQFSITDISFDFAKKNATFITKLFSENQSPIKQVNWNIDL